MILVIGFSKDISLFSAISFSLMSKQSIGGYTLSATILALDEQFSGTP